jgi:uncharacterized membrane protein YczE
MRAPLSVFRSLIAAVPTLVRHLPSGFALSRAGAVAVVSARQHLGRTQPAARLAVRVGLLIGGALLIGLGASSTLASGLGPGPLDVLVTGISGRFGLPFAPALWAVAATLGIVAFALGRRPGPGTVIVPLIIGPVVGAATGVIDEVLPQAPHVTDLGGLVAMGPVSLAVLVAVHLFGVALIGVGAGATIVSGLGTGTGDLLAGATSDRLGRPVALVRTALELSWVGFGLTLGGVAGLGTVLVALTVGPAVKAGHGVVESAMRAGGRSVATADARLDRLTEQLAGTHPGS